MTDTSDRISAAELDAEAGTALPAKEVMSLLDLNANLDIALDTAAPIGLALGANANIAAPINAAVDANVLSAGSQSSAEALQGAGIHQGITGDATATANQHSSIGQGDPAPTTTTSGGAPTTSTTSGDAMSGPLLNVNVNLDANAHLASPIDGAIAANANAAAPINAGAAANVGSIDSTAVGVAHQDALIDQSINGNATATGNQDSGITQGPSTTSTTP